MGLTINDIPPEILQRIFLNAVENPGWAAQNDTEDLPQLGREFEDFANIHTIHPYHMAQRVLLRTCQHWRDVVFDTPGLWTNVLLNVFGRRSLKAIKSFLNRSGELPINVRLTIKQNPLDDGVLGLLRQHLSRVRILTIIMDTYHETFPTLFPPDTHTNLWRLERFYCAVRMINPASGHPPKLGTIHAPSLQSFMVHPDFGFLWRCFIFPSAKSLTRMSISFNYDITAEDIKNIAQCSNIRALNWGKYGYSVPENLIDFNFDHLQSLSLLLTHEAACLAVSRHFFTPRLERFCLQGEYMCHFKWVASYIKRNSQLKELMLHLIEAHGDAVDSFTHLTELTTLSLFRCSLSEQFIATFLAQAANGPILPNLKLLDVHPEVEIPIHSKWVELARHRLTDDEESCVTILYSEFEAYQTEWEELVRLQENFSERLWLTSMSLYVEPGQELTLAYVEPENDIIEDAEEFPAETEGSQSGQSDNAST